MALTTLLVVSSEIIEDNIYSYETLYRWEQHQIEHNSHWAQERLLVEESFFRALWDKDLQRLTRVQEKKGIFCLI